VREIAQNAGRDRWKIENQGFNSQKHGGFALEHLYSHNYNSAFFRAVFTTLSTTLSM